MPAAELCTCAAAKITHQLNARWTGKACVYDKKNEYSFEFRIRLAAAAAPILLFIHRCVFSFFLLIYVLWCFFEILRLFITEFAVCSCLYSHPGGMFCARAAIMLSWKNVFAMCFVFVSITIMGGKGSSGGKDGDSNRRRDGGRDVKRAEKA